MDRSTGSKDFTGILAMLTIRELLARHASELRPSDGDPACARHDGRELVGVLHSVRHEAKRFTATLMPNIVDGKHEWWGPHDHTPGISVRNLRWDKDRAVWIGTPESQQTTPPERSQPQ